MTQFPAEVITVSLSSLSRDMKFISDLLEAETLGIESQHRLLSDGEGVELFLWIVLVFMETGRKGGRDIDRACQYAPDGIVQLGGVVLLEDESVQALLSGLLEQLQASVASEDTDSGRRPETADLAGGGEAVQAGHDRLDQVPSRPCT